MPKPIGDANAEKDFIDKLADEQRMRGLSDQVFARSLGISKVTWWRLKTRALQPGLETVAGAVRAYPHLTGEIIGWLNMLALKKMKTSS